jgi:hypothetical protein
MRLGAVHLYTKADGPCRRGFRMPRRPSQNSRRRWPSRCIANTCFFILPGPFFKWTHFEPSGLPMERHDTINDGLSLTDLNRAPGGRELW